MSPRAQLALVDSSYVPDFASVSDRRADERLAKSAVSWLNEVRLKYGPAVSLIDLSASGAQIEMTCHRLEPGRTVVIELTGPDRELSVPSRVVRCGVSGIMPYVTSITSGSSDRRRQLDERSPGSAVSSSTIARTTFLPSRFAM
jgi:PilZ domain